MLSILVVLLEKGSFFKSDCEHVRRGGFVDGVDGVADELMAALVDLFESDSCPLHHFADVEVGFVVGDLLLAQVLLQFLVDLADVDLGVRRRDELVQVDEAVQLQLLVRVQQGADRDHAFVADRRRADLQGVGGLLDGVETVDDCVVG